MKMWLRLLMVSGIVACGSSTSPNVDRLVSGAMSGGLRFSDANCTEELTLSFDSLPNASDVSGQVTGLETCVYTVATGQWQVGDTSGPNPSPIFGPVTGTNSGKKLTLTMTYYNSVAHLVTATGSFSTPTRVGGSWTCHCGATGTGVTGTWSMAAEVATKQY